MEKLNESQVRILLERAEWTKSDIEKVVKDTMKNDREFSRDMEKKVKEIVAKSVNKLFQTLWQRRNFYEDEIKR